MPSALLVGVDGSEESLAAAAAGERLAERLALRLVLAYAVENAPSFPYGHEALLKHRLRAATRRGSSMLDAVGPDGPAAERIVTYGDAAEALARLARDQHAALVVVGSRGRGAVKAALLGSVSRRLVGLSACPLVIVPPCASPLDPEGDEPRTLVCGVDGSDDADAAVAAAAVLAERAGYDLVIAHSAMTPSAHAAVPTAGVAAPAEHHGRLMQRQRDAGVQIVTRAARLADGRGVEVSARVDEVGAPMPCLERLAGDEDAAMIVVGSRGHGPLRAALMGSTSAALAASASHAVMVVPPAAQLSLEP